MPEGASPASFSVVERRTPAHRRSSAPIGDPTLITPSPALLVLEMSPGGSPEPGEAGRPAATVDRGSLFCVERPCEGAAGGGSQLRSKNAECADHSRVHAANVSPAEGGREGHWSADRALFRRNSCRGRAWGGCSAFSGPPPLQLHPLKTRPPRWRSHPGGRVRPAAQAYR
jgi:hypothetical protein